MGGWDVAHQIQGTLPMTAPVRDDVSAPQHPTPPDGANAAEAGGFRRLVRLMGWPYIIASGLARLPQSMLTIGALTYVAAGSGDFTTPGAVAAIAGVGVGIGAPIMGAASDAWGQRKVLLISALAYALALGALLWAGSPRSGAVTLDGPLIAAALVAGMVVPQVGPMTRVRWIRRLTGPNDRSSVDLAMGYESTVDELGYVLGPAAVGIVAAAAGAPIPLVIAGMLALLAVPAFAFDRNAHAGAPVRRVPGAEVSGRAKTAWGFMVIGIAGMLGIGAVFGSLATTVTVFADETGHAGTGGLMYAALGVTSGLGALSVSRWPARWSSSFRWLLCAALAVPATLLLLLPTEPWHMVLGLLLVGATIGPILVTVFSAAGQRTPAARLGLVMTLLSASITLGTSVGNFLGGAVSDASGHTAALVITVIAAVALLGCAAAMAVYERYEHRVKAAEDERA